MNEPTSYYTDDITLLPLRVIWRVVRRVTFFLSLPIFLYFGARKVLHLRPRANFGTPRPDTLPAIPAEAVPDLVLAEMAPFIEACAAAGFSLTCYIRPNTIGNKQTYVAVLLHSAGKISASVTWMHLSVGSHSRTSTVFACQSVSRSGIEHSTGPLDDAHWIPELIPPHQDLVRLPPESSAEETIRAHFERMEAVDDLVQFDHASLQDKILESTQKHIDRMIERGVYARLTPAEVERLQQAAPPIEAELA